jgi:hypothetical protein
MPGAGDPHGRPLMMTTSRQPSLGIIVVGASLAGLRASEALRAQGPPRPARSPEPTAHAVTHRDGGLAVGSSPASE